MKRTFILAIAFSTLLITPSSAQDKDDSSPRYTILGQVRHRFESSARSLNSDVNPINFNLLRTRLGVHFYVDKGVEAVLQIQDSRVMGEEEHTLLDGSADRLDMQQGYLKITEIFEWPLDVQLGRFQANYGSQRLIGPVEWHNIARSFDGVRFTLHPKNMSIDFFNFNIVEELNPGGDGDLNFAGINGDIKLIENYKTQAFIFRQHGKPTSELNRYTIGLFISGASGNFRPELELAYQAGEFEDNDIAALMATLNVGYVFSSSSIKPIISAGIDFLSGDEDTDAGTYKVFNTLYATNHKFYGYMDYFLVMPRDTHGLGLTDIHVKLDIKPNDNWSVRLAYHSFFSNEDYVLEDDSISNRFGDEVDLVANYNYTDRVSFTAGASVFSPGAIFKETKGPDLGTWVFLMTTLKL